MATQMLTLDPWQQVSALPAARRGISVVNLLLRITLRPIDRTLTSDEANVIRNVIYEDNLLASCN